MIVVLCGPSCVGKSTILAHLLKRNPEWRATVNYTTRAPREGEEWGREYYFIPMKTFRDKIKAGEFVEYDNIYGNMYGIHRDELPKLHSGEVVFCVLFVGSLRQMKENLPGADIYSIFIMPESFSQLQDRMIERCATEPEKVERVSSALNEISMRNECDAVVRNEGIDATCGAIESLIRSKILNDSGKAK